MYRWRGGGDLSRLTAQVSGPTCWSHTWCWLLISQEYLDSAALWCWLFISIKSKISSLIWLIIQSLLGILNRKIWGFHVVFTLNFTDFFMDYIEIVLVCQFLENSLATGSKHFPCWSTFWRTYPTISLRCSFAVHLDFSQLLLRWRSLQKLTWKLHWILLFSKVKGGCIPILLSVLIFLVRIQL